MKTQRNRHETIQARVALEALKGVKSFQGIASEYEVYPIPVSSVVEGNASAGAPEGLEEDRAELHAKIGEPTASAEWWTKSWRSAAHCMITAGNAGSPSPHPRVT